MSLQSLVQAQETRLENEKYFGNCMLRSVVPPASASVSAGADSVPVMRRSVSQSRGEVTTFTASDPDAPPVRGQRDLIADFFSPPQPAVGPQAPKYTALFGTPAQPEAAPDADAQSDDAANNAASPVTHAAQRAAAHPMATGGDDASLAAADVAAGVAKAEKWLAGEYGGEVVAAAALGDGNVAGVVPGARAAAVGTRASANAGSTPAFGVASGGVDAAPDSGDHVPWAAVAAGGDGAAERAGGCVQRADAGAAQGVERGRRCTAAAGADNACPEDDAEEDP